ncbi:hypothetical protein DY000_02063216 [Brassica cretica]|uniref:TFIIS N-terminal domain-containing protein n=1 Tax=Brassica cretica TaxID=69181 RepID=A0ABQ7AWR4_BRACR|nr:hypothetical protein DY000_02063216 [Brassica cretica]
MLNGNKIITGGVLDGLKNNINTNTKPMDNKAYRRVLLDKWRTVGSNGCVPE